jgi:hypothetical protein
MKFVLFICVEEGVSPTPEQRRAIPHAVEAWIAETAARGVRLGGWQMAPPADAAVVRVRDGEVRRSGGSFADPAGRVAGLNLLECASLDEALEVAARHPVAAFGTVEVRALEE